MKSKVKYIIGICFVLLTTLSTRAQNMIVNAFIPPGALIQKEQLWNIMISNPSKNTYSCQVSLTVLNKANGQKMLTAVSNMLMIPSGVKQVQAADVMPVIYNALNNEVDLSGSYGFLPVGLYQVCYELVGIKSVSLGSSCIDAQVEVLSPPQLILPENKSTLNEKQPSFSWLPPVPAMLVRNCSYEYKIVKVNSNQTQQQAIRDNVPVYQVSKLSNTFLTYPAFASALEKKQLYAWQITAQSSTANLKSDVWTFKLADDDASPIQQGDGTAYTKLAKSGENTGYSVVSQVLKFSYLNEGTDSTYSIKIQDVTNGNHTPVMLKETELPVFYPGMNWVDMDLSRAGKFKEQHMYEFSLIDKQGHEWKMIFEYKGKKKR